MFDKTQTAAPVQDMPVNAAARAILRGSLRHLRQLGVAGLAEFVLASGRRADILGVDAQGRILIVEIKSGLADFRSDHKWHDYVEWCDEFYFAVNRDMPLDVLPADAGLMLADGFGAEIVRAPAARAPLAAARRKALLLRFGLMAAQRLQNVMDPDGKLGE